MVATLRVSILHSSGSGMMNLSSEGRMEEVEDMYGFVERKPKSSSKQPRRLWIGLCSMGMC